MAFDTPISLRNMVIYQVFVRNYGKSGGFNAVTRDLSRIRDLGADVVYLLPIHPIGVKARKGSLGSPYSIADYRQINPEYGTLDDFKALLAAAREIGLKVMIDVVYNHTSRDSRLLNEHPEWFFKNANGEPANRVGDWSDVADLDYSSGEDLRDELIDTLKYWASMGVDGFRCDVASMVPLDFWVRARKEIKALNSDFIWLAESVHANFIRYIRSQGFEAASDGEMFQAFDVCYDYDVMDDFHNYVRGFAPLSEYISALGRQEIIYPSNYVKLRNLENHDMPRAAALIPNVDQLLIWTAFQFMQKGAALIYAGQEAMETKTPSLFDDDKVNWQTGGERNISDRLRVLAKIKKDPIMADGFYGVFSCDIADVAVIFYRKNQNARIGVFNFGLRAGVLSLKKFAAIKDGTYTDLIDESAISITDGALELAPKALIFDAQIYAD